jgi:hypothetical protein
MSFSPLRLRLTPGRGAPCSSVTFPVMAPVSRDCEKESEETRRRIMSAAKVLFKFTSVS